MRNLLLIVLAIAAAYAAGYLTGRDRASRRRSATIITLSPTELRTHARQAGAR